MQAREAGRRTDSNVSEDGVVVVEDPGVVVLEVDDQVGRLRRSGGQAS